MSGFPFSKITWCVCLIVGQVLCQFDIYVNSKFVLVSRKSQSWQSWSTASSYCGSTFGTSLGTMLNYDPDMLSYQSITDSNGFSDQPCWVGAYQIGAYNNDNWAWDSGYDLNLSSTYTNFNDVDEPCAYWYPWRTAFNFISDWVCDTESTLTVSGQGSYTVSYCWVCDKPSYYNYTVSLTTSSATGSRSNDLIFFRIQGNIEDSSITEDDTWTEWFESDKFTSLSTTFDVTRELTYVGKPIKLIVLIQSSNNLEIDSVSVDDESYTFPTSVSIDYNGGPRGDGCSFVIVDFENQDYSDNTTQYTGIGATCPFHGDLPTAAPTIIHPTIIPSTLPSISPSLIPSAIPTIEPSDPSLSPTNIPSDIPSYNPTNVPSMIPSKLPSQLPTSIPSEPSVDPTQTPTNVPSEPSVIPTQIPTMSTTVMTTSATHSTKNTMETGNTMRSTDNQQGNAQDSSTGDDSSLTTYIIFGSIALILCLIAIFMGVWVYVYKNKNDNLNNVTKMDPAFEIKHQSIGTFSQTNTSDRKQTDLMQQENVEMGNVTTGNSNNYNSKYGNLTVTNVNSTSLTDGTPDGTPDGYSKNDIESVLPAIIAMNAMEEGNNHATPGGPVTGQVTGAVLTSDVNEHGNEDDDSSDSMEAMQQLRSQMGNDELQYNEQEDDEKQDILENDMITPMG